ncbi:unnamed protein product [Blepharisma stoltei]|uniref:LNR domain-containing protein n=1 Tax=Blepharisma stoltei TaxID=1481888 RepID=A0AAU9JXY4_9CILI|nr:unnamed protein product [Blepharisma stoltei]
MTEYCNYDAAGSLQAFNFSNSDCFFDCVYYNGCDLNLLGNGICDNACNYAECGWDLGDCGYCNNNCKNNSGYQDMLGSACYSSCNTTSCYHGESYCQECSENCIYSILGDGICNEDCNNAECNFDFGDCDNSTCADGCYSWMINDGVCNEFCYVEECNYDRTDCDCAPGCSAEMLNNYQCDAECSNAACLYDNYYCGDCNSGCFNKNINDGICQDACWVASCGYDGDDCQCATGCNYTMYGQCNENCMTADCYYDQFSSDTAKQCKNTTLMLFYMHLQLVSYSLSTVQSISSCAELNCNTEILLNSQNSCQKNCDTNQCAYSWLNCEPEIENQCSDKNCKYCYGENDGQCYTCKDSYYQFYGYCLKACPCGYSAKLIAGTYPLCLPSDDESSSENPTYYYVTSLNTDDEAGGNGTYENPFESLALALTVINTKYSVVVLLDDGVHYLTELNKTNIMWITSTDSKRPFNSQIQRKSLLITTENNNTVYLKPKPDWNIITIATLNTAYLSISNVIFDGNEWVHGHNNCLDGYCSYCPSVDLQFDGSYKDDRGNKITNFTDSSQCEKFHDWNLFEVLSNTTLELYNVTFNNWRMEENSLIFNSGGVIGLYSVDFDNIRTNPSSGSAVVVFENCYNVSVHTYGCGDFIYSGGRVTRLNNGFEYSSSLTLKGFFWAAKAQAVYFLKVAFENNAVYSSSNAADDALIYLETFRSLTTYSCIFSYNVVYSALIYLKPTTLQLKSTINSQNELEDYVMKHVTIEDTMFSYNYGFYYGIFAAQYQTELQNIYWKNVTIKYNCAEKGALVYISNAVILDNYIFGQDSIATASNGNKVYAYKTNRCFYWDLINFIDNSSGGSGMWDFTKLVNLDLSRVCINSNGVTKHTVNSLVFSEWKANPNIYLKNLITSLASLEFLSLAFMNTLINLTIGDSEIIHNSATLSTPFLWINNSNITLLNNVTFDHNLGNSTDYPTILYINGGNQTDIISSKVYANMNLAYEGYGTVYTKGNILAMQIQDTNWRLNAGGLLFSGKSLLLENDDFSYNFSPLKGGAIFIEQTETSFMSVSINSCNFFNNWATMFSGGAIYMENTGFLTNVATISIKDSNFSQNCATYGAAIYIDNSVILDQNSSSWLSSSTFIENNSSDSGAVAFYFLGGVFLISDCEFSSNTGRLGASLHVEIKSESKDWYSRLTIESTNFTENSGQAVIYATNSDMYSHIITNNCIFSHNTATPIELDYDYWEDTNSVLTNNVGKFSGGARFNDFSLIKCENTIFSNNEAIKSGGAVSSGSGSKFYCMACSFTRNTANISGGAIFIEQNSFFNITKSYIKENKCSNKGSAIYMLGSSTPISLILDSIISYNNSTNEATIALLDSSIHIESSTITQNIASFITPGVLLTLSQATIANSEFSSQSGDQGSFIYAATQSTADIYNTTFTNGVSSNSAGAIYSISSTVNIYNGTFNKNSAKSGGGGVILSYSSSTLLIKDSGFYDSYSKDVGGVIIGYESDLEIYDTVMKNYRIGAIYGSKMNSVTIKGSNFYYGYGTNGGSLTCISCLSVHIYNCYYQGNTAEIGGAIYLSTSSDTEISNAYIVKDSSFWNNSASLGGAIYTNDISLNASSSTFVGNIANTTSEFVGTSPSAGNGGGLNLACSDFSTCIFDISYNHFILNYAKYNGGGINWEDICPITNGNSFSDNKAAYAPEISSFAIKLMAVDKNGHLINYRKLEEIPTVTSIENIASGQITTENITLALVDYYGNIVSTDSSSTAQLFPEDSTSTTISGTTKTTAVNGLYNFTTFIVSAKPGTSISIKITSAGIDTSKQSKASTDTAFIPSVKVDVTLRLCIVGEATIGVNCEVCGPGYYSLNPTNTECIACPSHSATCYGNYTIVPQKGYWRPHNMSDNFMECPKPSSCLGSPLPPHLSFTGLCHEGYTGNLCQACASGYSRTSTNTCGKCPDPVSNAFKVIGIVLVMVIVWGVMVKTTRNSAYKPKSVQSIYIKIFVNYLQLVMLMTTFHLQWPSSVSQLFLVQNDTGSVSQEFFSYDCFLDEGQGNNQVYFSKLVIMSIIPIIIAIISVLFWGSVAIYKKTLTSFKNDLTSTIVILLFLYHPNLVKSMFAMFSCREIEEGEYWLIDNLDIRCWDDRHIFYSVTVAAPSILVWGIGIPTLSLYFLWRNKRRLDSISVRLQFGFLFNGYKAKSYYWELVILYRKILIVCCSVFLANISTSIQALTIMMLLLFCLYSQSIVQPYDGNALNEMETRSILVATVTIYCGLYYLTGSLDFYSKTIFFILICAANIYFLYYWLKKMFGVSLQVLSDLVPCLRHRFSRKVMDGFSDDIFEKAGLNHIKTRQGERYFSMISNDDPLSSLPVDEDLEKVLNMDMKTLFLNVMENNSSFTKETKETKNEETNNDISYENHYTWSDRITGDWSGPLPVSGSVSFQLNSSK